MLAMSGMADAPAVPEVAPVAPVVLEVVLDVCVSSVPVAAVSEDPLGTVPVALPVVSVDAVEPPIALPVDVVPVAPVPVPQALA
jgi:hypothetical protein